MKLRLRIPKTSKRGPKYQHKTLHLPASLLADPAFSADPLSNPYNYPTGREQQWTQPTLPGHPSLNGRRRRRQTFKGGPGDQNNVSDSETETIELIQPPNSPISDSSSSDTNSGQLPSPVHEDGAIPDQSPPNHILSRRPMFSSQAEPRRKKSITRLGNILKKKKPADKPHKSSQSHDGHVPLPPSTSTTEEELQGLKPGPQLHRALSAPQARQGPAVNAPVRNVTSPNNTVSDPRTANRGDGVVDHIDRLDESNIFGASLHHRGPYEAVKSILKTPSRMPLGFQNDGRLYQYHEHTQKAIGHLYEIPKAPDGVPLNLSPAQVLPRNFRREQRKAPRFRNIVSALPAHAEVPEAPIEPMVPPRHQKYNQIPFHKSPKDGRRNRTHAVDENPLDGPDFDPSVIIGLAMLKEGTLDTPTSTQFVESAEKVEMEVNEEKPAVVEVRPNEIGAEGIDVVENAELEFDFDPYDPKNLEHPNSAGLTGEGAHEGDIKHAGFFDDPPPLSIHSHDHFSEEDFHANAPETTRVNPQFKGIPAGVRHSVHSPVQDSPLSSTSQRNGSSPLSIHDLHGHAHGGSEETLVQAEEDTVNFQPNAPRSPNTKPEITAALQDAIHLNLVALKRDEDDQEEAGHIAAAGKASERPMTTVIPPYEGTATAKVDDVGATSSLKTHASRPQYDKQLPPHPPISPNFVPPPPYRSELAYNPPHHRSTPSDVSTVSNVTRVSTKSYQSYSSTKGDDGHSNISHNPKPSVQDQIPLKKKPPTRKSHSVALPNLSSSFGSETFNRYPQPAPKRPAPSPLTQDQRAKPRLSSRSSVSSSSRSQLSPIQEDESITEKMRRRVEKQASQGSSHSSRKSEHNQSEHSQRDGSFQISSSLPYASHIRIEVGQVYPQHLLPPGTVVPRPAYQVPSSLKPSTNATRTPLMPVAQISSLSFSGDVPTKASDNGEYMTQIVRNPMVQPSPPHIRIRGPSSTVPQVQEEQISNNQNTPIISSQFTPPATVEFEMNQWRTSTAPNTSVDPSQFLVSSPSEFERQQHRSVSAPQAQSISVDPSQYPVPSPTEFERQPRRAMSAQQDQNAPVDQSKAIPPPLDLERHQRRTTSGHSPDSVTGPNAQADRSPQGCGGMQTLAASPKEPQWPRYQSDNASSLRPEDSASNRARSMTSYAPSVVNNPSRPPPNNRHLPRRLVMPAPLQPLHESMVQQHVATQKQVYTELGFPPRPEPSAVSGQQQSSALRNTSQAISRGASPPHILPPLLAPEYKQELKLHEAAGRKLKKRVSQVPRPGEIAPSEALNFEPVIIPPAEKPRPKPAIKPHRLSKRRTNL